MANKEVSADVKVNDKTAAGIQSASKNLTQFGGKAKGLAGELGSIGSAMNAGIFSGAGLAGIGAFANTFGVLNEAVSGGAGSIMAYCQETTTLIGNMQEASRSVGVTRAATELLTKAGIANASASQVSAASVLLMSNADAAAAAKKAIFNRVTNLSILSKTKDAAASVLSAAKTRIYAAASAVAAICTGKLSIATLAHAGYSAVCAAATSVLGIATKVCAGGFVALTAAMAKNPIGAILIAVTALIAAIGVLVYWFGSGESEAVKFAEANKKAAEEASKAANACREFGDVQLKNADADRARLERLEQLSKKTDKSASEIEESKNLIRHLSMFYQDLGLSIDEATWAISGFNDETEKMVKTQQAANRVQILKDELENLKKAASGKVLTQSEIKKITSNRHIFGDDKKAQEYYKALDSGLDDEAKRLNQDRQLSIRAELEYYDSGGIENVAGKSAGEIIRMKIEQENKLQAEQNQALKEREESEKKAAEAEAKDRLEGLNLQKQLEKDIAAEGQTALEKELDGLKKTVEARQQSLNLAIAEGRATAETYQELTRLAELQGEREKQIRARHQQSALQASKEFYDGVAAAERDAKKRDEDAVLTNEISQNPVAAMAKIKSNLAAAQGNTQSALAKVQNVFNEGAADGDFSEADKAKWTNAKKEYEAYKKEQERWEGHQRSTDAGIRAGVQEAMKQAQQTQKSGPVESLMRGSVEAYKREIENRQRQKTPSEMTLEQILTVMDKKYKETAKVDQETRDFTKKIADNIGAV